MRGALMQNLFNLKSVEMSSLYKIFLRDFCMKKSKM